MMIADNWVARRRRINNNNNNNNNYNNVSSNLEHMLANVRKFQGQVKMKMHPTYSFIKDHIWGPICTRPSGTQRACRKHAESLPIYVMTDQVWEDLIWSNTLFHVSAHSEQPRPDSGQSTQYIFTTYPDVQRHSATRTWHVKRIAAAETAQTNDHLVSLS